MRPIQRKDYMACLCVFLKEARIQRVKRPQNIVPLVYYSKEGLHGMLGHVFG